MVEDARSFEVIRSSGGPPPAGGNRYIAKIRSTAAKNAAKVLFRMARTDAAYAKFKGRDSVYVEMRETTRGATLKTKSFFYRVTKEKRAANQQTPSIKQLDGKKVAIKALHFYRVKAVDEEEFNAQVNRPSNMA